MKPSVKKCGDYGQARSSPASQPQRRHARTPRRTCDQTASSYLVCAGDELAPIPASGRCTTVNGVIVDDGEGQPLWKLLTGDLQQAIYLGPHWPNRTGPSVDSFNPRFTQRCGDGCLYDLRSDPLETSDLAHKLPEKVTELHAMIEAFEATAFNPRRGGIDARSCEVAATRYGGFWGPFLP